MLEWFKDAAQEAYSEALEAEVANQIEKRYVPRVEYQRLMEAQEALEAEVQRMKATIEALNLALSEARQAAQAAEEQWAQERSGYEAAQKQARLDRAVEQALTSSGARNHVAVRALLADFLPSATLDATGQVAGLSERLAALTHGADTAFLFRSESDEMRLCGVSPAQVGGRTPPPDRRRPQDMSYRELCAYLEEHPDEALGSRRSAALNH